MWVLCLANKYAHQPTCIYMCCRLNYIYQCWLKSVYNYFLRVSHRSYTYVHNHQECSIIQGHSQYFSSLFWKGGGRGGDLKMSTLPLLSKSNFSCMLHYSNPACTHLHLGKSHLRDNYVWARLDRGLVIKTTAARFDSSLYISTSAHFYSRS